MQRPARSVPAICVSGHSTDPHAFPLIGYRLELPSTKGLWTHAEVRGSNIALLCVRRGFVEPHLLRLGFS